MSDWETSRLIYLLLLLVVIAPGVLWLNRQRGQLLRNVAIWLAIAAVIALAYQFFQ